MRDPWFWTSIVFFSGWVFFLFYLKRHYWRIPPDIRVRISNIINRPIHSGQFNTPRVYTDVDMLCRTAVDRWIEVVASMECMSRFRDALGFPPEVFAARRRELDS